MSAIEERAVAALEQIAFELKRANDAADGTTEDRLVSCSEAAELCDVTPQTISSWIRRGIIVKTKKGRRVGVLLSTLPKREKNAQ